MDEETSGIDIDDDPYMDDGETSDVDDDDEELMEDSEPSPFQQAVSPDWNQSYQYSGKPLDISSRRGRGRPRKSGFSRGAKAAITGFKLKKWKTTSSRSSVKRSDSVDTSSVSQSPSGDGTLDNETTLILTSDREKPMLAPEDTPYFPEQWPGKVCAFCNLGERSQLGQGEFLRLFCPDGFKPQRSPTNLSQNTDTAVENEREGDKSPRTTPAVTCRRQKNLYKSRNPSLNNEYVDELTIIGHPEEPDIPSLFEGNEFYVHNSCAIWSAGVTRNEDSVLQNVGPVIIQSSLRKCANCNHFGASIPCRVGSCNKYYHFSCAAASGAFQDIKSYSLFCNQHLGQVTLIVSDDVTCMTCYALGDVANLVLCSTCGRHHHGTCVGLAQLPGVRAGWQCRDCRTCQVCRIPGEDSKMMICELCDKVYHPQCLRPIVTSIPKYGWKCKCCRVCTDCGSRTPGAGLSSRWHAHFTVCDSCYQQRNKGFSCPLCHRAYRAAAHREMVQCSTCHKFVHGTCDQEADIAIYQKRKETTPDYEYVCASCKAVVLNSRMASYLKRKNSCDDSESNLSASQESLNLGDDLYDLDADGVVLERAGSEDSTYRFLGLGKGKPFLAGKVVNKKRMGFTVGRIAKNIGGKSVSGKFGYHKRKLAEIGRKRGSKGKTRGFFGNGVYLEKPSADSTNKSDEEPGVENRLVLCSAKDRFVLTQDVCVMCGALGTDQEGCLIACAQCGQCYHPYCVNVKVTKVILEKGWRCLDCTVCEGCGQRNDESRLILCDDCDISYHIYCMDPPLEYVPHGNWKCKWCALCQVCGASDPGFNCCWMNSFTECGPCYSLHTCPSCNELYNDNELIIKCLQCERWLHGKCDSIKNEQDADRCADEGYNCILCRPRDEPPPHLLPPPPPTPKPLSPCKSPVEEKVRPPQEYFIDGVYLSTAGMQLIRSLEPEQAQRKKRRKGIVVMDKEAGIRATIESVVAGGSLDNSLEEGNTAKLELVDIKEEPTEIYKEGMAWVPKTNGAPPEGFTVYTTETGMMVLRKKRQRNLQRLGIGGFIVRNRTARPADNDDIDTLPGQTTPILPDSSTIPSGTNLSLPNVNPTTTPEGDKPRRKPARRKPKSKLSETFPSYIQDAFFGRELLDTSKEKELNSSSESEEESKFSAVSDDKTIELNQEEIKAIEAIKAKQEPECTVAAADSTKQDSEVPLEKSPIKEEDDGSDTEALKDVLELPNDLLDTDLVKSIMNEEDLTKTADSLDLPDTNLPDDADLTSTLSQTTNVSSTHKDELSDILNSHFNLPNMDSKDVEEIFKGVLTDEPQETQDPIASFQLGPTGFNQNTNATIAAQPVAPTTTAQAQQQPILQQPPIVRPLPSVVQNNMNSPMSFPPPSPYHSEYSNSPQFSPAFSEPPSPWIGPAEMAPETINEANPTATSAVTSSYNQRSTEKMKADEALGNGATISAVLYANINHPEWKTEYPVWTDRYKQILKKWRALSADKKAPYLQQARDNRSAFRMKKTQQITKESTAATSTVNTSTVSTATVVTVVSANQQQMVLGGGRPSTLMAASGGSQPSGGIIHQQMAPGQLKLAVGTHQQLVTTAATTVTTTEVCNNRSHGGNAQQLTIATTATFTTSSITVASSPSTSSALSLLPKPPSTTTIQHQQFTVHNQYPATLIHSNNGPAPNVTVNPHYNPHVPLPNQIATTKSPPAAIVATTDQQIRVLTPSEIMRTLPSLSQDSYDTPQTMDQDKLTQQQKSVREAEQERQWKQLQASRQQQAQQQQQVIHDQRLQAIARVRHMTENGAVQTQQFPADQILQVNTQDGSTSPSQQQRSPFTSPVAMQANRTLLSHSPNFTSPSMPPPSRIAAGNEMRPTTLNVRSQTPVPSPSPFSPPSGSSTPVNTEVSAQDNGQDPYLQSPQTPRPFMLSPQRSPGYPQLSGTPKPQFNVPPPSPRPASITPQQQVAFIQQNVVTNKPDDNRQLRDLLQRQQQFKKLDEQLMPGAGQQRVWPPQENVVETANNQNQQLENTVSQQQTQQVQTSPVSVPGDATFRHPLPPALVRTRAPITIGGNTINRQFIGPLAGIRQPQTLDPRMKLLLQQQQQRVNQLANQQAVVGQNILRPGLVRTQEVFDQQQQLSVVQRQQIPISNAQIGIRIPIQQQKNIILEHRVVGNQVVSTSIAQTEQVSQSTVTTNTTNFGSSVVSNVSTTNSSTIVSTASETQEIPDSVTAELEKLEQEGGGMVEVEGVSELLGGLGDDDDELLAEMGADFNILEYADPELDALTGGEKTNILDSLDLEEPESDKEDTKAVKKSENTPESVAKTSMEVNTVSDEKRVNIATDTMQQAQTPTVLNQQQEVPTTVVESQQQIPQQQQQELKTAPSVQMLAQSAAPALQQQPEQPLPEILAVQPQAGHLHPHVIQTRIPTQQQQLHIQQQMHQQVQNAAALGRPIAPGTRLMSPDGGVVGIVTSNNTVSVSYPNFFTQDGTRFVPGQLAQQRIQMRMAGPRLPSQLIQHPTGARLPGPPPPPPPPPYPGPPPPYPGSASSQQQQISQQLGGRGPMMPMPYSMNGGGVVPPTDLDTNHLYAPTTHHQFQRRPLLLQEQPLLLEELLEQEKREQENKLQNIPETISQPTSASNGNTIISDQDLERLLRTDMLGKANITQTQITSPPHGIPAQNLLSTQNVGTAQIRPSFHPRPVAVGQWQNQQQPAQQPQQIQSQPTTVVARSQQTPDTTTSVPPFNIPLLPAPPLPPENIVTEQDRQTQLHYEQWLNHQNQIVQQQLKYYETEVQKLRKQKKSLNSKQRQLRKSGNQLSENDAFELQRVSSEQAVLQKQLEASRKQSRQHGMLIQEYRNKQQVKQQLQQQQSSPQSRPQTPAAVTPGQLTGVVAQNVSRASPVHHTPTSQSPLMSPTQSPMMVPHGSPMHSPGPMIINSPGPASVASILQSPGHPGGNSMSPHNIQPRIGTPQSDDGPFSPGTAQSPSGIPIVHRMPVVQRHVTSPGSYTADIRPGTPQFIALQQNRFIRPAMEQQSGARPRLQNVNFQQAIRTGGRSPLASPQPIMSNVVSPQHSQIPLSPQQGLQRQTIQQVIQVQQQPEGQTTDSGGTLAQSPQRTVQLVQQRQLMQQQLVARQQQLLHQQTSITVQLHHQQLLQQQINQQKLNQQQQNQALPNSPLAPPSPMVQTGNQQQQTMLQMISHGQRSPSHAPPRSPMISGNYNQPPSSPMPRSPMVHQQQIPPNSPMLQQLNQQQPPGSPLPSKSPMPPRSPMITGSPIQIMRPPSNNNICSPMQPERPQSVENPGTPRTPSFNTMASSSSNNMHENRPESRGGGSAMNSIPCLAHFGSRFKPGLRGGSPMWSFGKGTKRIPQHMGGPNKDADKPGTSESQIPKLKKESHVNKVSILKKKSPRKLPDPAQILVGGSKVGSLVCAEYNEFDDSSSTPPISPPPLTPTVPEKKSNAPFKLKMPGKKAPDEIIESNDSGSSNILVVDSSPEEKHLHVDFDDDNDKTLVASEISLNSVAQEDIDDMPVVESFSQQDLTNVISSPLETGVAEEYVLFSSDMVGDISVECDDTLKHLESDNISQDFVGEIEILNKNVEILTGQSPTGSDIILTEHGDKSLSIDLLGGVHIVSDTPESPDQKEMNIDPSSPDEDILSSLAGSEILVIDPSSASPEEHIATAEDFEELIDGEKRDELVHKLDARHILEIHKYASNPYTLSSKSANGQKSTFSGQQQTKTGVIKKIAQQLSEPVSETVNKSTTESVTVTSDCSKTPPVIKIETSGNSGTDTRLVSAVITPQITSAPPIPEEVHKIRLENTLSLKSSSPSIMTSIMSLTPQDTTLPSKIFQDESGSPEESGVEENNEPDSPIEKYAHPALLDPTNSRNVEQKKNTITKIDFEEEMVAHSVAASKTKTPPLTVLPLNSSIPPLKIGNQFTAILEPETSAKSEVVKINATDIIAKKAELSSADGPLLSVNVKTFPSSEAITDDNSEFEPKSVEISIPSPTPSQEKMLDNLARQALEVRGREDKQLPNDFQTIEDMLDMIENITSDSKLISEKLDLKLDKSKIESHSQDSISDIDDIITNDLVGSNRPPLIPSETKERKSSPKPPQLQVQSSENSTTVPISVATTVIAAQKHTVMPQLSPLSQPTELTTNMANVSQQLRTFLSSLATSTITTTSTSVEPIEKIIEKTQIVSTSTPPPLIPSTSPISSSRIIQQPIKLQTVLHTSGSSVIQNIKQKRPSPVISPQRSLNSPLSKTPPISLATQSKIITTIAQTSSTTEPKFGLASLLQSNAHAQQQSSVSTQQTTVVVTNMQSSTLPTAITSNKTIFSANQLISNSNVQKVILASRSSAINPTPTTNTVVNITTTNSSTIATTNTTNITTSVITPAVTTSSSTSRVSVPSLNAMLQSHPAATIPQTVPTDTITTASILASQTLGPGVAARPGLASARPSQNIESKLEGLAHKQETLALTSVSSSISSILGAKLSTPLTSKGSVSTTNLLHTHLTKSPLKRTQSNDDSIGTMLESSTKAGDSTVDCEISSSGCKYSTIQSGTRVDDSQNVLLKQLLQNTGCATTTASSPQTLATSVITPPVVSTSTSSSSASSVPSLEAQLARPVPPTHTPLLPPLIQNETSKSLPVVRHTQIMSRETSFLSRPIVPQSTASSSVAPAPSTGTVTQTSAIISQSSNNNIIQQSPQQNRQHLQLQLQNQQLQLQNQQLQQNQQQITQQSPQIAQQNQQIQQQTNRQQNQQNRQQNQQQAVQQPLQQQPQTNFLNRTVSQSPTQQLFIEVKRGVPPVRSSSRDELLSPSVPKTPGFTSNESSLQTPPIQIKREISLPEVSPSTTEMKKEILDESSQQSSISDQGKLDISVKEEQPTDAPTNESVDKSVQDALTLKRLKRRQYQQKRRKIQIQAKEASAQPKKRPRKTCKLDEDYDVFNDNLMAQLRQLPPMIVMEPILGRNYSVCPVWGSGDLSKIGTKNYNTCTGDLAGVYGQAYLPDISDYYNTKPFGPKDPLPEKPPVSTQRGFYDQEFEPIKFNNDDNKRIDLFFRECDDDTPDTIINCSSPECCLIEGPVKHPGLSYIREIDEDDMDEELERCRRRSPDIPLIAPIPIRLKPGGQYLNDYEGDIDKENYCIRDKSKNNSAAPTPLKDFNNVTVTLTLTSSAAEDIMGVLRDLANILHIPAPTGYQIVERTTTPPSQKLGLYRTKGKDGKEGAPIDIQSVLNGAAKFCRHCDVVILNTMIRKKVADLPFLAKDSELLLEGDELFFCSSSCYMQFALMHRAPNVPQEKVAAIIDHLSGKDNVTRKSKLLTKDEDSKEKLTADLEDDKNSKQVLSLACNKTPADNDKAELKELSITIPVDSNGNDRKRKLELTPTTQTGPQPKCWKGMRYKQFKEGTMQPDKKHKRLTEKEMTEYLFRLGISVMPAKIPEDTRKCMFCHMMGDSVPDGPARLLNFDVDKWVHLNCALWSDDVYETVNGALMNLENALQQSLTQQCVHCQQMGATIRCFKVRCSNVYHLGCAVKDSCVFYKNKTVYCTIHALKNEKENELTTLSVYRRVYVNRDENRQVAAVMHHSDQGNLLRVGSLIFLNVGQILPHQLQNFHTPNYIYPIGYKIVRFYWSMRRLNKRCRYVCSIHDVCGRPEFRILIQEPSEEDLEMRDASPRAVWSRILDLLATLRRDSNCVQVFPRYITGEDLFGLTEPAIVRVLESLPGIETLTDYRFKYGRNPLLELPLAINPSGAARTEPRLKNALPWKRPHTQRTGSSSRPSFAPSLPGTSEAACPYSKQFVHSKSSQYKKMKQEWRNNVYLARSKIQGLGLYATRDLEKHTMVIEYIGEMIRTELAELREKQYEAKNRGIYMFRLDEERVVDATLCGGLARYINHSCNPNCVAEIVEVDRDLRIIIFAKRRISRGEELAYDYKFDIEDDQHKISCMCGAPNCRKWMN